MRYGCKTDIGVPAAADGEYIDYLRQKVYCCWHQVADDFYESDAWLDEAERMFRAAKPMMDMMNAVIDDYE